MRYVKKNSKIDGYAWICKRPCTSTKSIRQKTPFISSRLKFKTTFRLMYKYINNLNLGDIAHELNIGKNTVTEYADMIRTLIVNYITTSNDKIGGYDQDNQPIYVEIDENLFFKAKYNRGAHSSGQWYVGGVERGTKRAFIVPVVDRTKETMINVISENVHPGSIIITDEWRSYRSALDKMGVYTHFTVNHSLNFINPDDPVIHTQKIEGFWSLTKRYWCY